MLQLNLPGQKAGPPLFPYCCPSTSTCSGSSRGVPKGLAQTGPGSQVGILGSWVKELRILVLKLEILRLFWTMGWRKLEAWEWLEGPHSGYCNPLSLSPGCHSPWVVTIPQPVIQQTIGLSNWILASGRQTVRMESENFAGWYSCKRAMSLSW